MVQQLTHYYIESYKKLDILSKDSQLRDVAVLVGRKPLILQILLELPLSSISRLRMHSRFNALVIIVFLCGRQSVIVFSAT